MSFFPGIRVFQARDRAGGKNRRSGAPVGSVPSMFRFGARAEDLARIVGADLVLIAICGDYTDVAQPFLMPGVTPGTAPSACTHAGCIRVASAVSAFTRFLDLVGGGIQVVDDLLVRITAVDRRCRRCADPWWQARCVSVCAGSLCDSKHRAGNIRCAGS